MHVCIRVYIYIYIHIGRERERERERELTLSLREMGGAPRNHSSVWIVKPSGCRCADGHSTSRALTEEQNIS